MNNHNHVLKNLSLEEIAALRQSLNVIDIKGSSAQFIATLQQKLDNKISEIQQSNQTPPPPTSKAKDKK
jgi:hypothetical protein